MLDNFSQNISAYFTDVDYMRALLGFWSFVAGYCITSAIILIGRSARFYSVDQTIAAIVALGVGFAALIELFLLPIFNPAAGNVGYGFAALFLAFWAIPFGFDKLFNDQRLVGEA